LKIDRNSLPPVFFKIAETVEKRGMGGHVFLAGGAVRDLVIDGAEAEVSDLDFVVTTPFTGMDLANFVGEDVGGTPVLFEKFGTARVDVDGFSVDCVTARSETYRFDSRNPSVQFSSLVDDAFRRDFTVNSLFMEILTGEVIDITERGLDSIEAAVIDTATEPDLCFSEDPLRMLRAIRFSAKLGFIILPEVLDGIKNNKDRLEIVSVERVRDELVKLMAVESGYLVSKAFEDMQETGLLKIFLPELSDCVGVEQNKFHSHDVFDHTMSVLTRTSNDPVLRWSALFHDVGKPATKSGDGKDSHFFNHHKIGSKLAEQALERLKFSNDFVESVSIVVLNHMRFVSFKDDNLPTPKAVRRFVFDCGELVPTVVELMRADVFGKGKHVDDLVNALDEVAKNDKNGGEIKPPLNGHEIMEVLQLEPGPVVGEAVNFLLEASFEDPNMSKEGATEFLLRWWKNQV